MATGSFFFLTDKYFVDFPDPYIMKNKEKVDGQLHERPCFYAFNEDLSELLWMIPISSNIKKYMTIYQNKISVRGVCDTIQFGYVLGRKKAFLIQNMCPATMDYISNEYYDAKTNSPVRVDGAFERILIHAAKKVLALERQGVKLIFPNVLKIEEALKSNA